MSKLYELLTEISWNASYSMEIRSYSGRGMYGDRCIGVELESDRDMWRLAQDIGFHIARSDVGEFGLLDVPAPRTDSMGLGIIVYWPNVKWDDETMHENIEDEDLEDA